MTFPRTPKCERQNWMPDEGWAKPGPGCVPDEPLRLRALREPRRSALMPSGSHSCEATETFFFFNAE